MLIIRREQMKVFSEARLERFERELLADLRRCYPADCEAFGDAGVLQLIRGALKRGATYGITAERDVATLAELDLSLGAPFERQKGNEWASAILADKKMTPGSRLVVVMARLPRG